MIPRSKVMNIFWAFWKLESTLIPRVSGACRKSTDAFNKKSNIDDAKELTGWKKVSQFVYCAGSLFLHS